MVRWFSIVPGYRYGPKIARLPKVGFMHSTDDSAFGFLDPSLVIRGCHLIPAFADGRTSELLPSPSIALPIGETDDWKAFYVMMYGCPINVRQLLYTNLSFSFVDRDMYT